MKNTKFKVQLMNAFVTGGLFVTIAALWEVIDMLQFGKPQPSISDTIIGMILAFSLTESLKLKAVLTKEDKGTKDDG